GRLVAVTKTGRDPFSPSGDGYYHFCVAPGTYYVKYQRIFSLNPTQAKRGNDPQKDSDVTGRNGVNTTDKFTVTSGQSRLDIDAGFIYGFMMMGIVYQDDNENNARDSGENGLDDLTLGLYDENGDLLQVQNSAEGGMFEFTELLSGKYTIATMDVPANILFKNSVKTFELPNITEIFKGRSISVADLESIDLVKSVEFGLKNAERDSETQTPDAQLGGLKLHNVSVYPNPVQDDLNVRIDIIDETSVTFRIFDPSGKQVLYSNVNNLLPGKRVLSVLDVRDLPAGLYLVKVEVGDSYYVENIVVGE